MSKVIWVFLADLDPLFGLSFLLFFLSFPFNSLRAIWSFWVRPFSLFLENTHFVLYKYCSTQGQAETIGFYLSLCINVYSLICLYVSRLCRDLECSDEWCLCGGYTYKWYTYIGGIICVESKKENWYEFNKVTCWLLVVVMATVIKRGSKTKNDESKTWLIWCGIRKLKGAPLFPRAWWKGLCCCNQIDIGIKVGMQIPFDLFMSLPQAQKKEVVVRWRERDAFGKGGKYWRKGHKKKLYVVKFAGSSGKPTLRRSRKKETYLWYRNAGVWYKWYATETDAL